jgi:site-specific DNA-methyltransferase (adenine-specific)
VRSDADTGKAHHVWGQDYGAFADLVERLTLPGQTVVDPFMGAGTTLLAAHHLGRHVVGCDIDAEHVATATARFGEVGS